MIKLGEFVLQHSGHLVLNLQHEVMLLKPVRNSTKNGYRLAAEKLTIPGRKDQRTITWLNDCTGKTGNLMMLIEETNGLRLHLGHIVDKAKQGHSLKIPSDYQI